MFLQDFRKNYIITLVDTSENEIIDKLCMEGFAHHQFLLVDNDGYAISQEVPETRFSSGDVIYIAAGRRLGIRCKGNMKIRHIAFTGRNIRPLLHYCKFGEFCITSADKSKEDVHNMFSEIFSLQSTNSENKHLMLSAHIYSLLAKLGEFNIERSDNAQTKNQLLLSPVTHYMQANYRNPSLSDIPTALSKEELDNLFLSEYSVTLSDYYRKVRMENAKHLLFFYANSGIEYIAANMGYSDVSEFENDFYNHSGISTSEFISQYI